MLICKVVNFTLISPPSQSVPKGKKEKANGLVGTGDKDKQCGLQKKEVILKKEINIKSLWNWLNMR